MVAPQYFDDWEALDLTSLQGTNRGEEFIKGLLREGEVCGVVNSSKEGKTWFATQLAWCIATGKPFLGLEVKQGRVLIIDNELRPGELNFRNRTVAEALDHTPSGDEVTIIPRRGKSSDINLIATKIKKMDLTGFSLIIIDALYKCIPKGTSENENSQMGEMMNTMQSIADETGVPLIFVHHTTKGDQSHKGMLDMAAGAGSIGRSVDAMIAIREHEEDGHSVCEFKARTNEPREPISIKFDFPIWKTTEIEPTIRKSGKGSSNQRRLDGEADGIIFKAISSANKAISKAEIRGKTGMGDGRIAKSLNRLFDAGKIYLDEESVKDKKTGKSADRWKTRGCSDGCTDGCTGNKSSNNLAG